MNVSGNSDVFFPVGADLVSANRMSLNMNGFATDNFTVVVGKGDLLNTPQPRVNRIWYVTPTNGTNIQASMKLYFTKRDWTSTAFPVSRMRSKPVICLMTITWCRKTIPGCL